jgi:CIC family chloride channel protein
MNQRPRFSSIFPAKIFDWVPQVLRLGSKRIRRHMALLGSAVLVGLVAGGGAVLFYIATRVVWSYALGVVVGYRAPTVPTGEPDMAWLPVVASSFRPWLLLLVPSAGGILSGLLVFTFAPEAEGHGTDAVVEAYHQRDGSIRPRVPLVKMLASALTIGTGGSGGREGPIAQIGAGFGSFLATAMRLRPADRRVLCAAGMGAGIAAIFRAPLAGALFASEVLYWSPEFEPEVIIPAGIASVVSYCTFGGFFGWQPLFSTPDLHFGNPWQLLPYVLLALCMTALAMVYTRTFYGVTRLFHRLPITRALKPALGAGLSGAIGVALYFLLGDRQVLAVLSFGYGALQGAMMKGGITSLAVLVAIALGKILTTSLTIGSGGSGGVFGPSMVIGGCAGGALGIVLHRFLPTLVPDPASFVIVGMAGFFAAAAKTPFSTLVIVSEMTGGYHLLLPALWVCVLSFMLSDRVSLYAAQLETRASSPAHRGALFRVRLDGANVQRFLRTAVPLVHPRDSLSSVIDKLADSRFAVLPLVDDEGRLLGVINREEVLAGLQVASSPLIVAADLARTDIQPLLPDDPVDSAQEQFVDNDVLALPVVQSAEDRRVLGMVTRFDISSAYVRAVHGSGRSSHVDLDA